MNLATHLTTRPGVLNRGHSMTPGRLWFYEEVVVQIPLKYCFKCMHSRNARKFTFIK